MAAPIPRRIFSWNALASAPAKVGPPEHPRSPANANKANKSVPLPRTFADAMLNVPGQNMPTENPARPQPDKAIKGLGTNTMIR